MVFAIQSGHMQRILALYFLEGVASRFDVLLSIDTSMLTCSIVLLQW